MKLTAVFISVGLWAQPIPKTWDDARVATHEVPLAHTAGSPKHVSSDYYYRIPVRPIYKGYPVYAPDHEPPDYMEWLMKQEPVILWDDRGHAPPLKTQADWIRAGQMVFDSGLTGNRLFRIQDVRNPAWYEKLGVPVAKDGTVPIYQYIVRTKGKVDLVALGCAACHTRVMPDGSILRGAQSNFPIQRVAAYGMRANAAAAADKDQYLAQQRLQFRRLHATPFLKPDMEDRIDTMSAEDIASVLEAVPPGTGLRQRSNTFLPMQVPDLIGVKDRRYLDRTGLELHRDISDFMRYSAMNQLMDSLASYAGFIPAGAPEFRELPGPENFGRYSDEQLYALALYVYSLQPPPNPNRFDALAARGQNIFKQESCGTCHTPPLYTNNKLTPVKGFDIPPAHKKMFDGSCATLEDWFDPRRLRDDYVPTGFKGYQVERRAVPGHEFGLKLSPDDKLALIAFLKTL
jgi:hypothetical protein